MYIVHIWYINPFLQNLIYFNIFEYYVSHASTITLHDDMHKNEYHPHITMKKFHYFRSCCFCRDNLLMIIDIQNSQDI